MHLETLRLYCDVVRRRSFSRGAELSHVSQSAASQAVQQLEREVGVTLIDRSSYPVTLTSYALRLTSYGGRRPWC